MTSRPAERLPSNMGGTSAVGVQRFAQVARHWPAVLPECPGHAQQLLHEAAVRLAGAAERVLAPQQRRPQRRLRRVVGRLHAVHAREGPQRPLRPQDQLAHGGEGKSARTAVREPAFRQDAVDGLLALRQR
jgi:hypothetical protein